MTARGKLLRQVLSGRSDAAIPFTSFCALLRHLGFAERIKGSHHIFTHEAVAEILNLQPRGPAAKPYQVRQVRDIIVRYQLAGDEDEV